MQQSCKMISCPNKGTFGTRVPLASCGFVRDGNYTKGAGYDDLTSNLFRSDAGVDAIARRVGFAGS